MADNVTGNISAQDLRDLLVTIMEEEFMNPGDFWARPSPQLITTDKTAKGWKMYSQIVDSDCSFMNVMHLTASGTWERADVADSTTTGILALAMDSYTSDDSTAVMLRQGLVYDSSFSATFSGFIGSAVFLGSGTPGSIAVVSTTNSQIVIGYVEHSDDGGVAIGKWRFEPPTWSVKGS
jgi:hypothetical protein